jgi:hypothetical protein
VLSLSKTEHEVALSRIVLERDHQPGSTPKLNAARADKALCLLDCNRVVSTNQRFESVEMPVVPDEIRPIFFHPIVPYGRWNLLVIENKYSPVPDTR